MALGLLGLSFLIAFINWIAVARGIKKLEYVTKPGVMITILAWLWQIGAFSGEMLWFSLGIFFSLAGDIFLVLPREQFILGLISFLIAHICYVVGLNTLHPPFYAADIALFLLVALTGVQIYTHIAVGLKSTSDSKLIIAVLIYSVVISLMVISALFTLVRPNWEALPSLIICAGALCFFISDILQALNRFVKRLRYSNLFGIISYHLGQILIVLGAALHYLNK